MKKTVLIGHGREMIEISREDWGKALAAAPARFEERLKFMSAEHHLVRNFVVCELPIAAKPLSAKLIAGRLNLTVSRVQDILDELEKNLTFIFRNNQGDVFWAYPVTVSLTPHQITFDTGEELYAA
jgi:DNA-binding MarR family transcriptional regulator